MTSPYRQSLAIGGSDAAAMVKDYGAWAWERSLRLTGQFPSWLEREETDAMKFGTIVHMAILEPARYLENAFLCPQGVSFATREGKDIKARFEAFQGQNPDAFLLRAEQVWAVDRICDNFLHMHHLLPLRERQTEVQYFGQWNGYRTKGTIDLLTPTHLIDIKTTRDIHNIENTAHKYGYHVQLAHYNEHAQREKQGIIFVESQPPFRCEFLPVSEHEAHHSRVLREAALERAMSDNLLIKVNEDNLV